ncbi:MAG: hypothetical protein IIV29_05125 [Tidjanibacter sp.]|nr:hypothetical protein [Tidjanibacter sp.]
MKRKLCFLFVLPLLFTACEKEIPDKTYTEYDGVALPQVEWSRAIMNKMLNLIEQQGGKFSDKDLLDALSTKEIKYGALYYVYEFLGEQCWANPNEMDGYGSPDNMLADDDGVLYIASHLYAFSNPDWYKEGEIAHYLSQQGYDGWYTTQHWTYDSNLNVFATVGNSDAETYAAKVIYYDGATLILKGKIVGLTIGAEQYDNLYLFELTGKHDSFFERRTSGEEYYNIWDTYCKANGVENEFNSFFFTNTH